MNERMNVQQKSSERDGGLRKTVEEDHKSDWTIAGSLYTAKPPIPTANGAPYANTPSVHLAATVTHVTVQ